MGGIDIERRGKEEEDGAGRERSGEEEEGTGRDIHRMME